MLGSDVHAVSEVDPTTGEAVPMIELVHQNTEKIADLAYIKDDVDEVVVGLLRAIEFQLSLMTEVSAVGELSLEAVT